MIFPLYIYKGFIEGGLLESGYQKMVTSVTDFHQMPRRRPDELVKTSKCMMGNQQLEI